MRHVTPFVLALLFLAPSAAGAQDPAGLGVAEDHLPAALNERSNESYVNRYAGLESSKNAVRSLIRSLRLGWLWQAIGSLGLRDAYRSVNRMPSAAVIPPMHESTRRELQRLFADELTRLEQLSGLRLDGWRAAWGETQ